MRFWIIAIILIAFLVFGFKIAPQKTMNLIVNSGKAIMGIAKEATPIAKEIGKATIKEINERAANNNETRRDKQDSD